VTDYAGLMASGTFALTVAAETLTITTSTPMVGGQQGSAYSQALTAVGGVTPYTWSLTGGTLPTGLSLDSLGDLTGTPATLGTFAFTVQVTDRANHTATQALALTVVSPTLAIATAQLPDGQVDTNYSATLSATGEHRMERAAARLGPEPRGRHQRHAHQWRHLQLYRSGGRQRQHHRAADVHRIHPEQRAGHPRPKLHPGRGSTAYFRRWRGKLQPFVLDEFSGLGHALYYKLSRIAPELDRYQFGQRFGAFLSCRAGAVSAEKGTRKRTCGA
jgi:hypothetical protein